MNTEKSIANGKKFTTPQPSYPALAQSLGLTNDLYLKREDLGLSGSHKGRSIPVMMNAYRAHNIHNFVISSSGNAAIAAADAILDHESLVIFVGKHIDEKKLQVLREISDRKPSIRIEQLDRPKQAAIQHRNQTGAVSLRQSTDDLALVGYESLAKELNKTPNLQAIFIPTSSGTTAQALGEWFLKYNPNVQIHIVQTEACHPIAAAFINSSPYEGEVRRGSTETSIASAIVDRTAHRKEKVVDIIRKTHGSGWIVSDAEIQIAIQLVKEKTDIDISPNSALSVAGLAQAIRTGWQNSGAIVCLITGA